MKFLTLISGKSVKLAPGVKRIPKEEFSELLDAVALQDKIKEEEKVLREQIKQGSQAALEEAEKRGFDKGLKVWAGQIKHLEDASKRAKSELQKFLVQIVMATAKKVVGRELEQNPNTLADIVMKNLRAVSSHRKITIFVNKTDLNVLEQNREALKKVFNDIDSFNIQARDDIKGGGAIIETEAGIIDARSEKIWDALETALDELIKKNK